MQTVPNKGAGRALVQSCKQRLVHYKQVWISFQSARRVRSFDLSHTHTHSPPPTHTHTHRECLRLFHPPVYFWGDRKMIKAVGADSGNDPLSISGVSYYTHANKQATSFTHWASETCRPVDRLLLTTHLYKVPCISAPLVSAGPALLVSLVWGQTINLSAGCCRDLLVLSIPSLHSMSPIFLHVFWQFQMSSTVLRSRQTQEHTEFF